MKPYESYICPEWGGICAYTELGMTRKTLFLRDGMRLVRKLAKEMDLVFDPKYPSMNKAGIAVAGEVYARMWNRGHQSGLLIEVCEATFFPGQHIQLRVCKLWPGHEGHNRWFSPYDPDLVRKLTTVLEGSNA
jgi:hypothetical protein